VQSINHTIGGRLHAADVDPSAPPQDYTLDYGYEGVCSEPGDLSSIGSGDSNASQRYNELLGWGPQFAPLADIYCRDPGATAATEASSLSGPHGYA